MDFEMIGLLLLLFGYPLASYLIQKRSGISWLSPVLQCYAVGILWANLPFLGSAAPLAEPISHGSIVLGLPLLLFVTDLRAFLRQATPTLIAFGLCVISGVVITVLVAYLWQNNLDQVWIYGGMLVGVYTGGTPNMNLIGIALEAPGEAFVYLNGADIITGGIFLLILLSVGKTVYGRFLRSPEISNQAGPTNHKNQAWGWPPIGQLFQALGTSITVAILAAAITYLLTGGIDEVALLLLLLTTLSLMVSFSPRVRSWQASYPLGEYLLLVFSVAIGTMADFSALQQEALGVLGLTAIILFSAAVLHLLLCRLLRIDRDTAMITATAAFYGPPFVPQVASALQNPRLIFPGVICGLAGFAVGNYLGIGVGKFLQNWLLA
jgi:uncharacterized membrane protein